MAAVFWLDELVIRVSLDELRIVGWVEEVASDGSDIGLHGGVNHAGTESDGNDIRLLLCHRPAKRIHGRLTGIIRTPCSRALDCRPRADKDNPTAEATFAQGRKRGLQSRDEGEKVDIKVGFPACQRDARDFADRLKDSCVQYESVDGVMLPRGVLELVGKQVLIRNIAGDYIEVLVTQSELE